MSKVAKLNLTQQVNRLLEQSKLPATLTIEQCADELAMSMTSFRRKLSQEETSFKLIQNKYLNELCISELLRKETKIDPLVIKLGYSERATFERSFRQKFGITPAQFRKLGLLGASDVKQNLTEIAQNLPPLATSCQELLQIKETSVDIENVTSIVESDPIYAGRVMGLASKAIYGKTPQNIQEAISRNLGINTVINLALVFAVKDMLNQHISSDIIEKFTQAFIIAPKLFQHIRRALGTKVKFNIPLTEQTLTFALLGIFLLSHENANKQSFVQHSLKGVDDLRTLNISFHKTLGVSVLASSSIMLSLWHMDATLIKELIRLDKLMQTGKPANASDELVLFMLSVLYSYAVASKSGEDNNESIEQLISQANQLQIADFPEIYQALFTA